MTMFSVFAFIWGCIWGSFLNVVIYRLPRDLSVVRPGSHCPQCRSPIRYSDNIPVLSWFILKGRCRDCGSKFSIRYAMVELLTGTLSLLLFMNSAKGPFEAGEPWMVLIPFGFYFVFLCALIAISFIDLDTTLIPDVLTLPVAVLGVIGAFVIPKGGALADVHPQLTWLESLLGGVLGLAFFSAVYHGYRLLTGRVGLGSGDITMAAMIGTFVGWRGLLFVLFFASFQGTLVAIGAALLERVRGRRSSLLLRGVHKPEYWDSVGNHPPDDEAVEQPEEELGMGKLGIPFGPFLGLAAVEYLLWGELFENWMSGGMGLFP